jgi:hypothetical protein
MSVCFRGAKIILILSFLKKSWVSVSHYFGGGFAKFTGVVEELYMIWISLERAVMHREISLKTLNGNY